jgi:hypothetical protein
LFAVITYIVQKWVQGGRVMRILALSLSQHMHIFIVIHTAFCVLLLSRKLNVCFNKWNAAIVNVYIFYHVFIIGIFLSYLIAGTLRGVCVCVCVCICGSFCFMSETNIMWTLSHLFSLEICLVCNGIQGITNTSWLFIGNVWCRY